MTANMLKLGVVCVCLLAAAGSALADPVGGPKVAKDTVKANDTDVFTVAFQAKEVTRVRLTGDGDTCLELRVYDENGNLVADDTVGFGDKREVLVTPKWTGKFTIKIRNLGNVHNRYTLTAD